MTNPPNTLEPIMLGGPAPGRPSNSLHYAVGEISGKLDQVIAYLLPQLHTIREDHAALEVRVGNNEKMIARAMGGGAVVVFLVTAWEVIRVLIIN